MGLSTVTRLVLKDYMSQFGEVVQIHKPPSSGDPATDVATVRFATEKQAERAMAVLASGSAVVLGTPVHGNWKVSTSAKSGRPSSGCVDYAAPVVDSRSFISASLRIRSRSNRGSRPNLHSSHSRMGRTHRSASRAAPVRYASGACRSRSRSCHASCRRSGSPGAPTGGCGDCHERRRCNPSRSRRSRSYGAYRSGSRAVAKERARSDSDDIGGNRSSARPLHSCAGAQLIGQAPSCRATSPAQRSEGERGVGVRTSESHPSDAQNGPSAGRSRSPQVAGGEGTTVLPLFQSLALPLPTPVLTQDMAFHFSIQRGKLARPCARNPAEAAISLLGYIGPPRRSYVDS